MPECSAAKMSGHSVTKSVSDFFSQNVRRTESPETVKIRHSGLIRRNISDPRLTSKGPSAVTGDTSGHAEGSPDPATQGISSSVCIRVQKHNSYDFYSAEGNSDNHNVLGM